jgi:hypothetical protein
LALSPEQIISQPLAVCYRASMGSASCIGCDIAMKDRAG